MLFQIRKSTHWVVFLIWGGLCELDAQDQYAGVNDVGVLFWENLLVSEHIGHLECYGPCICRYLLVYLP